MELVSAANENSRIIILKKKRTSNFELLRIILMIFIVTHHYIVNSGIFEQITTFNSFEIKSIIALCVGGYGKIAINVFVLITGYFMCKSEFRISKWLKLYFEILFYNIVIYLIFLGFGYESYDVISIFKNIFIFYDIRYGFSSAFLIFYLFVPFLNILINHIDKKKHLVLIILLVLVFSLLPSIPKLNVTIGYVGWFMVLYIIVSFIRMYPNKIYDSNKITGFFCLSMLIISVLSIVACYAVRCYSTIDLTPYFFVSDCNKIIGLMTAIAIFLFVKNIHISYNLAVNTIAKTTFGVLLIHANSSAMRQWLWRDFLNNVGFFKSNDFYWHCITCVISIYVICVFIDLIRIYCIETPLIKFINKKKDNSNNHVDI